jgi:ribosome maturation factor RimP
MKAEKIKELLQPTVEALGYELWTCQYIPAGKHSILRVFIDKSDGIQLEDCGKVSRQISALLDVEDPISGHYTLEVSSPGLDRPLIEADHYKRFVGCSAKVKLVQAVNGKKKYFGVIEGVESGDLMLSVEGTVVSIPLTFIIKANLVEAC